MMERVSRLSGLYQPKRFTLKNKNGRSGYLRAMYLAVSWRLVEKCTREGAEKLIGSIIRLFPGPGGYSIFMDLLVMMSWII